MNCGIYNRIYLKNDDDLFDYNTLDDIKKMASALNQFDCEDAALETVNLWHTILHALNTIQEAKKQVPIMKTRLEGLWKAVECYDSGELEIDAVKKAIKKYREEF